MTTNSPPLEKASKQNETGLPKDKLKKLGFSILPRVPFLLGSAFELFVRLCVLLLQDSFSPSLRWCLHAVWLFQIRLCFRFRCRILGLVPRRLSRRLSFRSVHRTRDRGSERFFLRLFFPLLQQSFCLFGFHYDSKRVTSVKTTQNLTIP